MKNSPLQTAIIGIILLLSSAAGNSVQAQQMADEPNNAVTINTDLVITWAQVFDHKTGRIVRGLESRDFRLREDGKLQQVRLITQRQPLSVVMLVKVLVPCGKKAYKLDPASSFHRSREALRQLGDDAEIALMGWDHTARLVEPLTRNHSLIAALLGDRGGLRDAVRPRAATATGNEAELSRPGEAIYQAAKYLEQAASPERRKVIIMVDSIDWIDIRHQHTAAETQALIEKTGVTVYGLYQHYSSRLNEVSKLQWLNLNDARRRSGGTLEDAVEQTGGSLLIGRNEDGDQMLSKLVGLIRSSYTIGYYPEDSDFNGRFRRISLKLSRRGRTKAGQATIKTRGGYQALRPSLPTASEVPLQ
jgi:VWFA-related protein